MVEFDAVTQVEAVTRVLAALNRGTGGRIITPNVDILRRARVDPAVRAYLDDATLVVADGMPLVWASRLAGTPLPERVAGASLIWSLSYHLARAGRSVYLLGGDPRTEGARRAAEVLAAGCPGLRVAGHSSPEYGFEQSFSTVCGAVVSASPDVVYVGLGFPKQEWVISRLRAELPAAWFLGCGAAISFVAGDRTRAPQWMQRSGLEWAHRLAAEPRRLGPRYLLHDTPHAVRILLRASASRVRRGTLLSDSDVEGALPNGGRGD